MDRLKFHNTIFIYLFLFLEVGWDWVHLVRRSLIGLFYQPRMIDHEYGTVGGMRIDRGNRSTRRTCPSTVLSTTNPTWPDPDSNPRRRGGKPVTNRLSYDTVFRISVSLRIFVIRRIPTLGRNQSPWRSCWTVWRIHVYVTKDNLSYSQ
jgi:hypothetical protein